MCHGIEVTEISAQPETLPRDKLWDTSSILSGTKNAPYELHEKLSCYVLRTKIFKVIEVYKTIPAELNAPSQMLIDLRSRHHLTER
jgi:hypothetical protein